MTNLFRYHTLAFLYFMAMTLSLTVMPIYFKNHHAISAYGLAYSVMAITGAFSFIYGLWVDKFGYLKMLIFSILIYGVALGLRVFTDTYIAIVVAIMAGIGASTGAICIRSWTAEIARVGTQNSTKLTATRSVVNNASILAGTGIVSVLLWILPKFYVGDYYFVMLLLASAIMIFPLSLALINYKQSLPTLIIEKAINQSDTQKKSYHIGVFAYFLIATTAISGIYTGMIKPYLILMFIDYGMSESKAVSMYLFTTATSMATGILLLKFNEFFKNIPFVGLIICEIILALVFFGLAFVLSGNFPLWVLTALVMIRSGMLSLALCFDEVLQYQLLKKETMAFAMGLLGTAFLVGDAMGSLLTGTLIIPKNITDYVPIFIACGVLALINVAIVIVLKKITNAKLIH